MRKIVFLFVLVFSLWACGSGSDNGEEPNADSTTTAEEDIAEDEEKMPENLEVNWQFETSEGEMGELFTNIVANINGKNLPVIQEATGGFAEMKTGDMYYEQLPENSISACSGFYAGLLSIYSIEKDGNKIVVKEAYMDEGAMSDELVFEELKRVKYSEL